MIEICGDGLNLGMNECDDGNQIDGDGCSSLCKVEKGFSCSRQKSGPDICKNIEPFTAVLKVEDKNDLKVIFTKSFIPIGNSLHKS